LTLRLALVERPGHHHLYFLPKSDHGQLIRSDPAAFLREKLPRPVFTLTSLAYRAAILPGRSLGHAQQRVFERLLRVSTRGKTIHKYADSSVDIFSGGDFCHYQACEWLPVRRMLKGLGPSATDRFVDFGSRKGQALLIAGQMPFARVTGVEYDQRLSELARRNIEQVRPRLRAQHVECIAASALDWRIADNTSVVYFFNPFIGETFRTVINNVIDSYDRNPRKLHIVYDFPWEHDWLLSTGRLVVDDVGPRKWPTRPWWWRGAGRIVRYRVVGPVGPRQPDARFPRRLFRPRRAVRRWAQPNGQYFTIREAGRETVRSYSRR